jgi:hypothetical protein
MQDAAVSGVWNSALEPSVFHQSLKFQLPYLVLLFGPRFKTPSLFLPSLALLCVLLSSLSS